MLKEICKKIVEVDSNIAENPILYQICNYSNKDLTTEEIKILLSYFDNNFNKFCSFCQQNNIMIDFSGEDTFLEVFGDSVVKQKEEEMEKNPEGDKRINSLEDGLFLVRKMKDVYPKNDVLQSALRGQTMSETYTYEYGGETLNIEDLPGFHSTTHWTINCEVRPHRDAPEGWKDSNVVIIQPLTEKIYDQLAVFNPIDSFGLGDIELEDYYVICDSQEVAQKINQDNPNAIPIVYPADRINNNVCLFLNLLGKNPTEFKFYEDAFMDLTVPQTAYYTEEFLNKYSKFQNRQAVRSHEHELYNDAHGLYKFKKYMETINSKINGENKEEHLSSFDSFMKNLPRDILFGILFELDCDFVQMVPERMQADAKIVEDIKGLLPDFIDYTSASKGKYQKLNKEAVDEIFSYIIEGAGISEQDIEKYKKLKMYFIADVSDTVCSIKDYCQMASTIYKYKKIVQSKGMELELDDRIIPEIPEEFKDYIEYFTQIEDNSQKQGTFKELLLALYGELNEDKDKMKDTITPISLTPTEEGNHKSKLLKNLRKSDNAEFIESYIKDLDISEDEKELYRMCLLTSYGESDLFCARLLEVKNIYMRTKSEVEQSFTLEGIRRQATKAREGVANEMMTQTNNEVQKSDNRENKEEEIAQE